MPCFTCLENGKTKQVLLKEVHYNTNLHFPLHYRKNRGKICLRASCCYLKQQDLCPCKLTRVWQSGRAARMKKTVCWDLYSLAPKYSSFQRENSLSLWPREERHRTYCFQDCLTFESNAVVTRWWNFFPISDRSGRLQNHQKEQPDNKVFVCHWQWEKKWAWGKGAVSQTAKTLFNPAAGNRCLGVCRSKWNMAPLLGSEEPKPWSLFQSFPLLLMSQNRINIPCCAKRERPGWHHPVAYSHCHEIVPRKDAR